MKINHNLKLSKKDKVKRLKLPSKISPELAEIVGIHFGDGCMQKGKNDYRIGYSSNIAHQNYIKHIKKQFQYLFNIHLKKYEDKRKSYVDLYTHSKTLCNFFNIYLQIPFSPKNNLTIPKYILLNKTYLKFFIRGVFDTDGCFTIQRDKGYNYNLIKITTKIESFAKEIKQALTSLDIRSYICHKKSGYDVVIRRKESYSRFINLINPKNNKK